MHSITQDPKEGNPLQIPESTLTLRPYQRDAIDAIEQAEARGVRRPLIALPTGTGKTVIFAHFIRQRPGRALVLAHRDELISQAADKFRMVDPELELGIVKAERNEMHAAVVLASVQTLSRPRRLAQIGTDFTTVVCDEAHHCPAPTYKRVCEHLGCFDDGPLLLGMTATPERHDEYTPLGHVFQEIVYSKTILDMIPEYLADLRAKQITLQADFNALHVRHGDFLDDEVEEMLLEADAPRHVAAAYLEHARGRKALIFTPTVALAYAMVEAFKAAGVTAVEALDGTTPLDARRSILRRLRTGETAVVANCAVLTEGFDEPSIDCIIVSRLTKSRPLYIQMVGRGTRKFPGKNDCLILDVVGVTARHDLITIADLFALEPQDLEDETVAEAVASKRRRMVVHTPDGELVATDVNLFCHRPLHWVHAREGSFTLSLGSDAGWLVLRAKPGDRWDVVRMSPKGLLTTLASGQSLAYAQGRAEDFARRLGSGALVNSHAAWRNEPMSNAQRRHLLALRIPVPPGLTKGQAADMIDAAKAGHLLATAPEVRHG
jgi:ATP-dependent helicase IRC3